MRRNRKNDSKSSGLGLLIFLIMFFAPEAMFALLPLVIIGAVIYSIVKSAGTTQHKTTTTTRQEVFDDCPQSFFCRHKDKGEHHVKQGKEVDPWDRPDIDISKYQRKE
jgi:hypothetical protein